MPADFAVFIDLGSSLIKVFTHHQDQLQVFLLSPRFATLSKKRLQAICDANPNADPEDLLWLEREGQRIAVGHLADTLGGNLAIKPRKMEPGVFRILAVLGMLKDRLQLPTHFTCDLGVALPVAEYADREAFAAQLRIEAQQFSCRGQVLSVTLRLLDVQIEAMGLVRDRRAELLAQGKSSNQLKIVALMFGHRNLSVLTFTGSTLQLEASSSSGPGFILAVETAARELSVEPTTHGLTELVAQGVTAYRFEGSIKPRDTTAAVHEAKTAYWQAVADHLHTHLPSGHFEIVAAGGALRVIEPELTAFFEDNGLGNQVSFAPKLQEKLLQALTDHPPLPAELALGSPLTLRLLDAFVGMQTLLLKGAKQDALPAEEPEPTSDSPSDSTNSEAENPQAPSDATIQHLRNFL